MSDLNYKLEDVQTEDGFLPAGDYEIAVVFRGQDNVIVSTNKPIHPDELAQLAKGRWANGEISELGNEWQTAEHFTIKPIETH